MSLVKWLLPDEWILKLFPPNEDEMDNKNIYLHFEKNDITLKFKNSINRYEVIQFIKQIHDDYMSVADNIYMLAKEYFDVPEHISIQKTFSVFQSEEIVFMSKGSIEIDHNKSSDGHWITDIYKNTKKSRTKLATISTIENSTESSFNSQEKTI